MQWGKASKRELLAIAVILLLAGILRMGWPGMVEFKADEARMLSLALDLAEGVRFPIRGLYSSVGLPNFPLSAWLYALPVLVWKHPYAATLFTGMLNTASVAACWWLARRYWGPRAALAAALLYAASPWAMVYSRKIWAQNLLPLFVVGWVATGIMAFGERHRRALAAHIVLLAVCVQLHLSAIALIPVTAVGLLLSWRTIRWRVLALGAAIALATMGPFLLFLATTSGNPLAALSSVRTAEVREPLNSLRFVIHLTTGSNLHSLAGAEAFRNYLDRAPNLAAVEWGLGITALIGLGGLAFAAARPSSIPRLEVASVRPRVDRFAAGGIVAWMIVPIVVFSSGFTPVFPHYFITTFPAGYIAAGWLFDRIVGLVRWKGLRAVLWALVVFAAILQAWALSSLHGFLDSRATPGGFGTPLRMKLAAARVATSPLDQGKAWEVLVIGAGDDPAVDEFPAVFDALLRDRPHRFVDGGDTAVRPLGPVSVLHANGPTRALDVYRRWSEQTARVPLRVGEGALEIMVLPPRPDTAGVAHEVVGPRTLENGVTLLGYELLADDRTKWGVWWEVGAPAATDYHMFSHVLDSTGATVAQDDRATFPAAQWQPGDLVLSFFDAEAGAIVGASVLRIGMYVYPEIQNVQVLDELGNPAGEFVTVQWAAAP